jgi:hypothetical protein
MFTKLARSVALVPLLIGLGTVSASADTTGTGPNMTMTVPSSATLIARVAIPVTVQITCSAPDLSQFSIFSGPFSNGSASVTVSQASGTGVNNATGSAQIVCDNQAHSYSVSILASAPFHHGAAAITASASWFEEFFGCLNVPPFGCNFFSFNDSASVQGPLSLTS